MIAFIQHRGVLFLLKILLVESPGVYYVTSVLTNVVNGFMRVLETARKGCDEIKSEIKLCSHTGEDVGGENEESCIKFHNSHPQ